MPLIGRKARITGTVEEMVLPEVIEKRRDKIIGGNMRLARMFWIGQLGIVVTGLVGTPSLAGETCQLVTHAKLSLADLADSPSETEHFYFSDAGSLTRNGKLTIADRYFEIEFEEFRDVYACTGSRNDPCILQSGDERFIGEARIDKSVGVVVQIERQVSGGFNPFSRGGVADGGLTVWKIKGCS